MAAETPVADPQGTVNRQQLRDHLISAEFREALVVHARGIGLVTNDDLRAIVTELLTHHTAEFLQQSTAIAETAAKMNVLADKVVQSTQEFDTKSAEAKAELSTLSATQALLVDQLNAQLIHHAQGTAGRGGRATARHPRRVDQRLQQLRGAHEELHRGKGAPVSSKA